MTMEVIMIYPRTKTRFVGIIVAFFIMGCSGDNGDGENANIDPISTSGSAEFVVKDIANGIVVNNILDRLDHGTFEGTELAGNSGNAAVSGKYEYNGNLSCGSDCTKSETDIRLTIVLDAFEVMTASNTEAKVGGTITYTDDRWSRQVVYSYASGGGVTIEGTDIDYRVVDIDGSWGYKDRITFSATGKSTEKLAGWCQTRSGETFSF